MTDIKVIRGDKNYNLYFTIYDADNRLVDLTDCTKIVFRFEKYEDPPPLEIEGKVLGDPLSGQAAFFVGEAFVGITGEYKAEIEITYKDGKVLTAPNLTLKILPDIG